MVFGIPLAKLVPELFKAVTKPMVNVIKRNVRKSPFWKCTVFIPMAQNYNRISVRVRLWTQGIRRDKDQVARSAKMSEEAALELGAEIVANAVTFIIGLMAILLQQRITSATEKKRESDQWSDIERNEMNLLELREDVLHLGASVNDLRERIEELNRTIILMKTYNTPMPHQNQSVSKK